MIGLYYCVRQNKEWRACAPMVNYWKAHEPVCFLRSCILSVTQQYKYIKTWKAPLQSIQLLLKIRKIHSWSVHPISWCLTPQFQQSNSFHNIIVLRNVSVILASLYKLSPIRSCEERMGAQRGLKVASWCKHCSCCGWWKGTSQDEATLISEEIKSVALAVLELCLSEGISKKVS